MNSLNESLDFLENQADELIKKSMSQEEEDLEKNEDDLEAEDIVDDEDTDSNEDEDKDPEESDEDEEGDEISKSIQSLFEENEEISKSIEVSEFLAAITEAITGSLFEVSDSINKSHRLGDENQRVNTVLAKSIGALAKSQAEIMDVNARTSKLLKSVSSKLDNLTERMGELESQPNMRKSVSNINVHSKNFNKSMGNVNNELSKSQVLTALNSLFSNGDKDVVAQDIIAVESGAPLRPALQPKISDYWSQNQ